MLARLAQRPRRGSGHPPPTKRISHAVAGGIDTPSVAPQHHPPRTCDTPPSPIRTTAIAPPSRAIALTAGCLLAPIAGELLFRVVGPGPRVQVVRYPTERIDGVPVWTSHHGDRRNLACITDHPERRRVVIFGSSILFGSGVDVDDVFSTLIQQRRDDLCIINLAQPAFTFDQKIALWRTTLSDLQPDVIFWEVWANDVEHFTLVGDTPYNFGSLDIDDDPGWLFTHSRAYAHFVLSRAPERHRRDDPWAALIDDRMPELLPRDPVLVFAPTLNKPFADSLSDPPDFTQKLQPWATENRLDSLHLARALVDQDVEQMRVDTCCHYSPAGHALLADAFEQQIDWRLARPH